MSIIDLKLKSYDELIFEITTLNTNNYLLQQKVEQLEKENKRLNNLINQADTKNLELIQKINKIYDVIENKSITGIEARLSIQYLLDKEENSKYE